MKIQINPENKICDIGDLFGIFFEDINHAADGGLYGELVRNRSFEFCEIDNESYNHMTAWEKLIPEDTPASISIQSSRPFSSKNPHYIVIDSFYDSYGVGIRNEGYNGGIPLEKGKKYNFSFHIACDGRPVAIEVSLENKDGNIKYASKEFNISQKEWKLIGTEFVSAQTDYEARLAIRLKSAGRIYADNISLFPAETFNNRTNGLRKDLAELLKDMKPKFLRFPGGCLIHDGSLNKEDHDSMYRWKNTIGSIYERASRKNNWRYNQSLGLGFYEYFLLCEDIGAKPLPVLPGGYDPHHQRKVPMEQMDEWIQDALDLIEFANGSEDTQWGRIRCEMGHKEPFGLEYIGIGNEEVGKGFFDRYPLFHKAIKSKYPDIKVINSAGPFVAGEEFKHGWRSAVQNDSDLIDEHYYLAPEWFIANHHHYDHKPPFVKTKVFLGEYASWGNTWFNALAEASYMIGLEKNAERVGLACYAPLFCNVDYKNWVPDMIWFDNHRSYVTPNYHVQKLFMRNQGDVLVECSAKTDEKNEIWNDKLGNDIILFPQPGAAVEYTNIRITDGNRVIKHDDVFLRESDEPVKIGTVSNGNYSVSMEARMIKGRRGFMIWFDCADKENKRSWEIGGWQNMDCAVCEDMNGRNTCLDQAMFSVRKGIKYELLLDVHGRKIITYVSEPGASALMNKTEKTVIEVEPVYCSASIEQETGDTIVKAVNLFNKARNCEIDAGFKITEAKAYVMSGYDDNAQNSFDKPDNVAPRCEEVNVENGRIKFCMEARSLYIFRIR